MGVCWWPIRPACKFEVVEGMLEVVAESMVGGGGSCESSKNTSLELVKVDLFAAYHRDRYRFAVAVGK